MSELLYYFLFSMHKTSPKIQYHSRTKYSDYRVKWLFLLCNLSDFYFNVIRKREFIFPNYELRIPHSPRDKYIPLPTSLVLQTSRDSVIPHRGKIISQIIVKNRHLVPRSGVKIPRICHFPLSLCNYNILLFFGV